MQRVKNRIRAKAMGLSCALGAVSLFSGCDLGTVTTSTTFDGREAIIQLVRGAVLTPIDAFITDGINELFGAEDD